MKKVRLMSLAVAVATGILVNATTLVAAMAGPLAEAAAKAEAMASSGDVKGAYQTIRDAFGAFAGTLPFTIGAAEFVTEKPSAYGAFTPRPDTVFKPGEPLITYVELIGLTWKPVEGGKMQSNFTVDLEVLDDKGDRLAAQKSFGAFTFTGTVRNQEIYTHLTLDVSGADAGRYTVRYTVNDTFGGRFTSFEQPFSIATP